MVVGYAAFNTELKISGTSKVTSNWDIRITNVTDGTPTGSAKNTVKPSWTTLTASMEADLYKKGDAMEYDVTIENRGTLDAKLNDILTNTQNSNSEAVIITFSGYTKGEILEHGKSKLVHVKIEYNPNYDGEPTSSEVEIEFDYTQENEDPETPSTYLLTYDYKTNGGERTDSEGEYLTSGSKVDLNIKAYKNGWTFVGWNTDKDAEVGLSEYQMPVGTSTLYAIYKKEIKVTYNKGSNIESIGKNNETCTIYNRATNCQVTLPAITPSAGYIIDGWYNGSSKVGSPNNKYTVSNNTTLTSKVKVDNISLSISTTSTTNSITIVANAQADSGISKYEYSIDNGRTWINGGTNNTYTYRGLTQNTSYDILVRVTSESGKTLTSAKEARTTSLVAPTFSESANSAGKTVTITYPSGCGSRLTCTYQKDNGEVVEVTSNTVDVDFEKNGNIVAKVTDDNGTMSSSYTVSGITSISVGTVKGGSIKLSKNKSINGENITFTTTPSSGFSYVGATVVCNNGSTHTISDITAKIGTMSGCDSSATIYPSWKRNDTILFNLNTTPTITGWISRYDTNATAPSWNQYYDVREGQHYYIGIANNTGGPTRAQVTSQNLFDITEYSELYATYIPMKHTSISGGTGTNILAVIPQSAGQNAWVQEQNNQVSATTSSNDMTPHELKLNISSLTGNYYIGVQMLATSGRPYGVDFTQIALRGGTTYSYNNRGI